MTGARVLGIAALIGGLTGASMPARGAWRPPLDGAFLAWEHLAQLSPTDTLAEAARLGWTTLILSATRVKSPDCTANTFAWVAGAPDSLQAWLDAAKARGVLVYLGLTKATAAQGCPPWYQDPLKTWTAIDTDAAVATLVARYGAHAALGGWYLPDEPGLAGWRAPQVTYPYYAGLVQAVRHWSTRSILVSPYMGGVGTKTPSEIAARAVAFRDATGVTVQAWQDSVGGAWVDPGGWGFGTPLSAYWAALATALGSGFWANSELFTAGYWPAPVARVNQQLYAARVAARTVSWLPTLQMSATSPLRQPGAARLYDSYRALYTVQGTPIRPTAYTWLTSPSPSYPDTAGLELVDTIAADPTRYWHPGWVGVLGAAEVQIDLGALRRVDWVAAHVLNAPGAGIAYPTTFRLWRSDDAGTWTALGVWPLPIPQGAGESSFGNPAPLNTEARYLRARWENAAWTFLSELELTAR